MKNLKHALLLTLLVALADPSHAIVVKKTFSSKISAINSTPLINETMMVYKTNNNDPNGFTLKFDSSNNGKLILSGEDGAELGEYFNYTIRTVATAPQINPLSNQDFRINDPNTDYNLDVTTIANKTALNGIFKDTITVTIEDI